MDVKAGFCWRCNEALQTSIVKCRSCTIAEYCSKVCMVNDEIRHTSVECPNWSVKPCGNCKHVPAKSECAGCYSVHYCNAECQRSDWMKHKPLCKEMQKIAKKVASRPVTFMGDYPFYFSNSFPNDLLNLPSNELKSKEGFVDRKYRLLLAACGDLRHVMKTVQSLPESFSGKLHFVLNDIDPFPMARNVLLLFMISSLKRDRVSKISTIWLSLQLPREDYLLLREMLYKLIGMDTSKLKETTGGMIEVSESSYNMFREVWQGWLNYPCDLEDGNVAKMLREKKAIFDADVMASEGLIGLLHDVPQRHEPSLRKFFDDGIVLPESNSMAKLTHCNPTFTGRGREWIALATKKSPSSYKFSYCIRSDCIPVQMWDYLDMIRFKSCDSISVMCHAFHTHLVDLVRKMLRDYRLSFYISTVDFVDLRSVINRQNHERGFDRIFASNLIDYHSISKVLEALQPFLSTENPHAVIFTETFNWYGQLDGAVWPTSKGKEIEITLRGLKDCNLQLSDLYRRNYSCFHEYYDNTAHFINYLRGEKHAEKNGSGNLPKLSDVVSRHGLSMRDFRKERNHVVPFNYRVAVRTLNMLKGDVRTLEWYRNIHG